MTDTEMEEEKAPAPPTAPRRGPGHRGADMRDTVAEMAERAQLISQEAGSKVSLAMKDVISAAAGLAGFAIESARDLVQYMVRRGQMTQEEGDKLIRDAEDAHGKKPASEKGRPTATKIAADKAAVDKAAREAANAAAMLAAPPQRPGAFSLRPPTPRPVVATVPAVVIAKPAAPSKPPAKGPPTKSPPAKAAPARGSAGKATSQKPAQRTPAKAAAKHPAKPAAKPAKGSASKPAAKVGKSAKAGSKAAAKTQPAKSKTPAKKKR